MRKFALLAVLFLFSLGQPAWAQTCQPVPLAQVTERLEQAKKSIQMVKFDGAVAKLDEVEGMIPCTSEVVPKEELTRMYLYRGVVAFSQDNEVAATAAFRRALAIDLTLRWDERFGQRPRELFLEAKASLLSESRAKVKLPRPNPGYALYVDGELRPDGGELEVYPGRHLLQVFNNTTLVNGVWFEVPGGGIVVPPVPPEAGKAEEVAQKPSTSSGGDEPSRDEPKEDKPKGAWMRPAGLGLMGVGGVSGVAGAAMGVVYLGTRNDLLSGEYYSNRDSEEKDALLEKNKTAATVTNITLPAAVVLGGAGAALFVLSGRQAESDNFSLLPGTDRSLLGMTFRGSF